MGGGNLPNEIVHAISISNAKSIGEQPAILSNLALATQILNNNMQQQMMIAQQQAINQIALATTAKCIAIIIQSGSRKAAAEEADTAVRALKEVGNLAEQLVKQMSGMFSAQASAAPPPKGDPPAPESGSGQG